MKNEEVLNTLLDVVGQLPEYIHQILEYNFWEHVAGLVILGSLGLLLIGFSVYSWFKSGELWEICLWVSGFFGLLALFIALTANIPPLTQIHFAPKAYLVDYLRGK